MQKYFCFKFKNLVDMYSILILANIWVIGKTIFPQILLKSKYLGKLQAGLNGIKIYVISMYFLHFF